MKKYLVTYEEANKTFVRPFDSAEDTVKALIHDMVTDYMQFERDKYDEDDYDEEYDRKEAELIEQYAPDFWKTGDIDMRIDGRASVVSFDDNVEEVTMKTNNNIYDMDSFGSDCPRNWEEICDYLNSIATEETAEQIWEDFCRGDLKEAPKPNFYEYLIRDKEAGNIIAYFETLEEAEEELKAYEEEDRKDGTYTPDFYEIATID